MTKGEKLNIMRFISLEGHRKVGNLASDPGMFINVQGINER